MIKAELRQEMKDVITKLCERDEKEKRGRQNRLKSTREYLENVAKDDDIKRLCELTKTPITFLEAPEAYIETRLQSGADYRIVHLASNGEELLAKTTQRREYREITSYDAISYIYLVVQKRRREITLEDVQKEVENGIRKVISKTLASLRKNK